MGIESHILKAPAANGLADKITKTLKEIKNNLKKAQGYIRTQADKKQFKALAYAIGDLVWLSMDNLCLLCASKWEITKTVDLNAVELLLPKSIYIHPIVNISWVKLYREQLPGQPTNQPGPSHVMEDQDKKYEVDYVIDSQWKGHRLGKGYDDSEWTWELLSNLSHAKEVISDFIHAHSNTSCHLHMAYLDFVCIFHQYDLPTVYDGHGAPFNHLEVDL